MVDGMVWGHVAASSNLASSTKSEMTVNYFMEYKSGIRVATAVNRKMIAAGPTNSGPERWLGFNSPTLHHWDLRVPFYYFKLSEYSNF